MLPEDIKDVWGKNADVSDSDIETDNKQIEQEKLDEQSAPAEKTDLEGINESQIEQQEEKN